MKTNYKKVLLITVLVLFLMFGAFCAFSYLVVPRDGLHYSSLEERNLDLEIERCFIEHGATEECQEKGKKLYEMRRKK